METFTWVADWQAKKKKKPEVNTIKFGDGYTQRVGIGANKLRETYEVSFSNSATIIKAIDTFLIARDGNEDFIWITPAGQSLVFYCEEWSADYTNYNNVTLTATFMQR